MSSQADALLSSMTGSNAELGDATLGTMVLGTSAYDSDVEEHIVIQPNRYIIVPEALKRIAVQHDHNIETVTFDCPRYWDEHDMSEMKIYINYIRADNEPGTYPIDNGVTVDEENDTIMHFDWTITNDVTQVNGNIVFLVCVKKVDDEGNEENHWNSELNTDMYVSKGLETQEKVISKYPDLITHLLVRMDVVEEKTTLQSMLGYLDEYFATDATINDVLMHYVEDYLQSDDDVTQQITDTINTYILEHLETTDPTLTIEGGIADAAATGKAIMNSVEYLRAMDSGSGKIIDIDGTFEAPLDSMTQIGEYHQNRYEGNQMLDVDHIIGTVAESSYIVPRFNLVAGTIAAKIESTGGTESGITINMRNDAEIVKQVIIHGEETFELTEEEISNITTVILYPFSGTVGAVIDSFMVNPGSEFLPYEPFTGGKSSPSKEYPQPIFNEGKMICDGWQLLDTSKSTIGRRVNATDGTTAAMPGITMSDYINVFGMTSIYISGNETNQTQTSYLCAFYDSNKTFISGRNMASMNNPFYNEAVPVPTGAAYVIVNYVDGDHVMVNKGTIAKPWEPYTCGGFTNGSQLAVLPDVDEVVSAGITWSCKDGVVKVSGTSTGASSTSSVISYDFTGKKGTYFVSGNNGGVEVYVAVKKADGTQQWYTNKSFILDGTETSVVLYCQVYGADVTVDTFVRPMLNYGVAAKPWQPHTNRLKPIVNIGSHTYIYSGNIIPSIIVDNNTYNGVNYIRNTDGTIVVNGTATSYSSATSKWVDAKKFRGMTVTLMGSEGLSRSVFSQILFKCASGNVYKQCYENAVSTFEVPADAYQMRFEAVVGEGATANSVKVYPSLRIGTVNDEYTVYVEPQELYSDINTSGIDGWADTRDWDRGVDIQRILRKEYNGTEGWSLGERNEETGAVGIFYIGQQPTTKSNGKAVCSHYPWGQNASVNPDIFDTYHRQIRFNAVSLDYTVDDWKAQLAQWKENGTPLTVYTQLVVPIETPIPEEELKAYRALHSNEPSTLIISDLYTEVEVANTEAAALALENEKNILNLIDKHEIRTYTNFDQLGLDYTTVDIPTLVEAMENNSIGMFSIGSDHSANLCPGGELIHGMITINKVSNYRTDLRFKTSNTNTAWTGSYYAGTWDGWHRVLTENDFSLSTDGTSLVLNWL